MSTEQERAEFEAWCDENEYDRAMRLDGTGYNNEKTKRDWAAWQARATIEDDRKCMGEPVKRTEGLFKVENLGLCDWKDSLITRT